MEMVPTSIHKAEQSWSRIRKVRVSWVDSEKIWIVREMNSIRDVEVACVSIFRVQGWVLAKNHQNPSQVCKVLVSSSVDPMSAMGCSENAPV